MLFLLLLVWRMGWEEGRGWMTMEAIAWLCGRGRGRGWFEMSLRIGWFYGKRARKCRLAVGLGHGICRLC